ncbi:MAG: ATP-binding protein [Bacteroidetes bacterium]|nr:ATP-binding protein [Bacteroidota bacterium]MBU1579666.1 ATP-binding protein [Bacteroidota bacterium]MBU2557797.1 ATP-binding protein [Bacteroidota bacterium]
MKRIAITGPESTGKSWLAERLAEHYNTSWVPEFARSYLEKTDQKYAPRDIEQIAKGQLELERNLISQAKAVLFTDTEMLVCKIWLDFVFGLKSIFIEKALDEQNYDLYLLCDIDLDWQPDPLREHPHKREELFVRYENLLIERGFPFVKVSGQGNIRLENAVNAVNEICGR